MDNNTTSSEEYNANSNEEGLSITTITTSSTTNNNLRTNNTTSSFLEDENEEDTEEVVEDLEDLSEEMNDDFFDDDDDIEGEYFMNQFQWRGYFAQDLNEDEEDNDFYSRALVSDNLENIYEICELGRNFSSEDEEEEEINNSSVNNNAFITIRHAIQQSKKKKQKIGLIHPSIKRNELTFKFDWKKRSNLTIEKTLFSIVNDPQFLSRESKLFILQSSNSSSLSNDNNFEQKKDNNIQYIIKKNNEEGNMYDIYKYLKYPEYNYIIVKPNLGNLFSIWSVQFPKYVTIEQKVYFEVTILQFKQDDIVCIGLAEHGYNTSKVFLDRETGWDNHSIGYHSDDGGMFDSEGFHSKRSSTYGKGDTIGCFWDLQKGTVIYTKNGKFINFKANRPLEKYGDFLPIITGRNRSGSIYLAVNFGTAPFVCGLFNEFYVMNYLNINLYQKAAREEFIDVNVVTKE
ncbi:hypothetical protein ABK040_005401 [Willaertia magna]